jgi:hypothetical protein
LWKELQHNFDVKQLDEYVDDEDDEDSVISRLKNGIKESKKQIK